MLRRLANFLTLSRVFLAPVVLLLYLFPSFFFLEGSAWPAALFFFLVLLELSDLTDGWVARLTNSVSDFGKIVDPMADTLVHLSLFFAFSQPPISLPPLLIVPFFYREILVGALRTLAALKGHAVAARSTGKIKTFLQTLLSFGIVGGMYAWQEGWIHLESLQQVSSIACLFVAIYTLYTGWDYFQAYKKLTKVKILPHEPIEP